MKNKKFNYKENQKAHGGFVSSAKAGQASLLRPVAICVLFLIMVLSSVFGFTGLFSRRSEIADDSSSVAYADDFATTWAAKVDASSTGSPQIFELTSDWVATVKDKDYADERYRPGMNRTEFGNDTRGFHVETNNSTYNYSGALQIPSGKSIILDLKGHKLDRNLVNGLEAPMVAHGYVIRVEGELVIKDSVGGGTITGGWNTSNSTSTWSSGILITGNGYVKMESGTITGGIHYGGGAVSIVSPSAKFEMCGDAKITGNVSNYFSDYNSVGGVNNYNGTFLMYDDAEISNNVGLVGGITHYHPNPVTILSGNAAVKNNISYGSQQNYTDGVNTYTGNYQSVGGVLTHYGTFTMNDDSVISGNQGLIGGLTNIYNTAITLNGNAAISNNVSNSYLEYNYSAGGVYLYGGSLTMNGHSTVNGNKGFTGGIRCNGTTAYVTMNDDSSVKDNASDRSYDSSSVGGIYAHSATTLTMNGDSVVSGNHAKFGDLNDAYKATLAEGTKTRNYGNGGIIYYGTVYMNDKATVKNNVGMGVVRGAGGVGSWDGSGSLYMRGGRIQGNVGYISGGVFKYYSSAMYIAYDPKVDGNFVQDDETGTNKTANDVDLHCGRVFSTNFNRAPTSFKNNVMIVEAGLEDGAHIGVVKYTNNYTTDVSASITKNYYINNSTERPSQFFFPSLGSSWFETATITPPTGYSEAGFISKVDLQNWQDAVANSSATNPQTIKLYHDVEAEEFSGLVQFLSRYDDGTAFSSGALHVPASAYITLDLNGHTIDRALTEDIANGYVIYNAGVLEITDTSGRTGVITGGKTMTTGGTGYGGGVYQYSGTLTLSGGSIEGNQAQLGGGVYVVAGTFNVKGGFIKNNTAVPYTGKETTTGRGGGVYATAGAVNVTGGTITLNDAAYGGGIDIYAANTTAAQNVKLVIKGGTITTNSATVAGGGINVHMLNTTFEFCGAPVIKENTLNGDPNDIHLPSAELNGTVGFDNGMIKVTAAITGSETYGVYRDIGYTFTKGFKTFNSSKQPSTVFKAQKDGFGVSTDSDGEGQLISAHGNDNWYSAVVLSRINGNKRYTVKLTEDWTAVRNTTNNFNTSLYGDRKKDQDTSTTGAYYYGAMNVPTNTNIVLDLNGYTIDRGLTAGVAGSSYGMVISVYGGTLRIIDTSEDGDGKITGGWVHSAENYFYGGGITLMNDASRLFLEGGNITRNKSTGYYSTTTPKGVGGVGLITASSQFTMTGGSITDNVGSFAGGVGFHTLKRDTFNLGGKPVIKGNCIGTFATGFGDGTPSDVHNAGDTAGTVLAHAQDRNTYKITIVKAFEDGTEVGICRPDVSNVAFMATNGNVFTNNYSAYNMKDGKVIDPSNYFFASNSKQSQINIYTIMNGSNPAGYEATVWNVDPARNWSDAHAAAISVTTGQPITVKLQNDWIADAQGRLGTGEGFSANGGMVMTRSNIILDLNGYTIDRGLQNNAIENGAVLSMSGTCRLEIIDSSEGKTGRIIGGNNLTVNEAGGINIASSSVYLTLKGGTITENKGDAGGVATYYEGTFLTTNYFAMGDSAVVAGNLNISDEPLNINLRAKFNQKIEILSELTSSEQSGVTKDSSSDFTNNYSARNSESPVVHFTNDSTSNYVVQSPSGEGALYTLDNYSNWVFAINESVATRLERTVMLVSDWTATDGMFGKSTSDNVAFYNGGALNVPANAKIILDLNGYTIDRNLDIPTDYGFVINVESGSKFTLRDSYTGDQRVGKITGGKNRTTGADYVGGGINNRDKLYIEGGVITGNSSTGDETYSSGGVFNDSHAGVAMYMTGGTITDNVGMYAGGVLVHTATNLYLGGSAVIKDNRLTTAVLSDVRPINNDINCKINIYSAFTNDAYIGVSYIGNNYADRTTRIFTTNFSSLNTLSPDKVFHYADPLVYKVVSLAAQAGSSALEAAVECVDNEQNWRQAIAASSASVQQTVKLTRDWVAAFDASLVTSFGSDSGAYSYGSLYVPSGRNILLDLNGFTLDRALTEQKTQGQVIFVNGGKLEIQDNALNKTGTITGGFSSDTAGGIHYPSGELILRGGHITGNSGTAGGISVCRTDVMPAPLSIGGSASVSGNNDITMRQSDIVANSPVQMINILSTMTAKEPTGFERPGVGEFTTNFSNIMYGKDPTDHFTSADPMYVYKADTGEAAIYTNDNKTNWEYAIRASIAGNKKQIAYMLVDDWVAEDGSFGTDSTAYVTDAAVGGNGALYVPSNADIVFDLNGYTLNRNLSFAVDQGYLFRIYGNLKVVDSSKSASGVITGGFNNNNSGTYASTSSVFYLYSGGRLEITGGTITGNRATGEYSSVLTLQYASTSAYATITGGTITGNYGGSTAINSTNGAGAVLLMSANTLKLGGTPKIIDNYHNNGYNCDVRLHNPGYYIEIIDEFKNGAKIGVAPTSQVDNWASDTSVGMQFTTNYSAHHSSVNSPERYFEGRWVQWHDVIDFKSVNGLEGALYCRENYTNWINAVYHSGTTKSITFQLSEDWVAQPHNTQVTSFHPTDTTYYMNGAIFLPYNRYIILDLNGHTIDRNLTSPKTNGYALYVRGHLEIIDTSTSKSGTIIGGYNDAGGGGIVIDGANVGSYVDNGLVSMRAGTVSGNFGTDGAGIYVMNNGARLELGGNAQIYGNFNTSGENSNVYIQHTAGTIKIVSAFTGANRELIGVDRPSNGDVTVGFQDEMYGYTPLDYFVSENSRYYGIESGAGEFFFLSPQNDINWEYAVTQSKNLGGKTQTVRLADDWIADKNDAYSTAFYTAAPTSNGIWYGALYVPYGTSIELDLAGYTLDRNLKSTQRYGLVILVLGKLTVIDSSDEGTGVIRGGHNSQIDAQAYAGGIHVGWSGNNATLDLRGGTITGNIIDVAGGAGAVYVWGGSTLNVNDAAIIDNHSPTAGVVIADGGIMSAGGKAVVKDNTTGAGLGRDVIFNNYTGVINVTSAFTDGAQIGVYRNVNNYDTRSMGGSKITADYSRYNTAPVETYFFASDAPFHDIIEVPGVGTKEAALFCYDNETNWYNAVYYSNSIRGEVKVTLYSDWTATARPSETITYFNRISQNGQSNNAYYNGALRVNSAAQIVLDLNNFVLDRAQPTSYQYGYVILVEGSLKIVDQSLGGASEIRGGYTPGTSENDISYAAGIHVSGGAKLSMEGGNVTANKGIGVYVAGNNVFSLGGNASVTGNQFDSKQSVNIYLEQNTQMINVISKFEDGVQFGVTRTKGANNYASGSLTQNYSKYNKEVEPSNYFVSDKDAYTIIDEGYFDDESMEAAFIGKDNVNNWAYAVKTSRDNNGRTQTFTLFEDWTAESHTSYGTSFGQEANGYRNGSLYVPYGASIILDLNGHTIDRNLRAARGNGQVIYVRGSLTIRDSSTEQTGTIRGGYSDSGSETFWDTGGWCYYQGYAGGISVYVGTLNIEGGTITDNKMTHSTVLSGGVYLSGGSTFTMTGGKITGNYGRAFGGVYVDNNAAVRVGSEAYIYGNEIMSQTDQTLGIASNLYFQSATNLALVTSYLDVDTAKIGISVNSDQIPAAGRLITNGWQTLNNDYKATRVFSTDHPDQYELVDHQKDGVHEAMLNCLDNKVNWSNTVQTSINTGKEQTFVLHSDWTADISGSVTSFGSGTGYYVGALYVPGNAKVILDLNGHTIDRDLYKRDSYYDYGYVFLVEGSLTIIDSTAKVDDKGNIKQGVIKGGYSYDGGALRANYGKLDVQAGLITENKAQRYGAGIFDYQGAVSIGGSVQFYNNHIADQASTKSDIMFYYSNYMLNISKPMQAGMDATYNDIIVRRDRIGTFTTNWGKNNPNTRPETRFKSELNTYRAYSSGVGTQREAVLLSNNNNDNWIFAVTTSLSNKSPERFTLMEDWQAGGYNAGSYTTSFGSHSQAYRNGALLVPAGASVVLDLNGKKLNRNQSGNTSAQYAIYNMTIIVEGDLQIIDSSVGGDGEIKGGSYGVYINNKNATVTLGGIPLGDTNLNGDEANLYGDVAGGLITGNSDYGVYVNYGTFTATNGQVLGNSRGGVFVSKNEDTTVNVANKAVLYNDKAASNVGLVMEDPTEIINIIDKLDSSARIGFSRQGVGKLTLGWGEMQGNEADPFKEIFICQEPPKFNRTTDLFDGFKEITISSYDNVVNWQAVVEKSLSSGKEQEFTLYACWDAEPNATYKTAFGTTSAYKEGALYVPEGAKVVLNLNGHKLNRNLDSGVTNGMVIYVDGELTIKSEQQEDPADLVVACCEKDGDGNRPVGMLTGGKNNTGSSSAGLFVGKGGNVVFESGRFSGNEVDPESLTATSSSGAVYVAGTFTMNGGAIDNNTGTSAGAVYVASSGKFVMNGGEINDNLGKNSGAVYTTGTFEFNQGSIDNNQGGIGAVYVASGGKFTMEENAEIHDNTGSSAGAVFVSNGLNTFFTMNGGAIYNNSAITAGAIYAGGKVEIKDGRISENTASGMDTTSDNDANVGGGAIYIAGTGNVTVTGGVITANEGVNGIRVHASGVLGVGGSAQIYENVAKIKNLSGNEDIGDNDYCDIYFAAPNRKLNVVSAFTDAAKGKIGIYRARTGIFTSGYGMYNNDHPNTFFVSNIETYSISLAAQENILENEASIGVIVDPAPKALDTPNVYNGDWQVIIEKIDTTKVSFDEENLPEGVRLGSVVDGYLTLEAKDAGTYMVAFELASQYCWDDGTVSPKTISGTLSPKVVELVWTDHAHAEGATCSYDGTKHEPTAAVKGDSLVGDDTCTVVVSGGEAKAGTHTATAIKLSNPNYALPDDPTYQFTVAKGLRPAAAITTATTNYRTPTQVEVDGNAENGTLTFSIVGTNPNASITSDGKLTITDINATAEVQVIIGETDNYQAQAVTKEIGCVAGELKTELDLTEMTYGDVVTLALKDYNGSEMGAITWMVEPLIEDGTKAGKASVVENRDLKATQIGKVKVTAKVEGTNFYTATEISGVVTINPKVLTIDWKDTLTVTYDGNEHELAAPEITSGLISTTDICNINVYKAGSAGWESRREKAAWTDAGTYDVGVVVSNENYCLADPSDYFTTFEIERAEAVLEFKLKEIGFNIPFKPEVEVKVGDEGAVVTVLMIANNAGVVYDSKTGTYTAKQLGGTVTFEATMAGTKNYKPAKLEATFEVNKAELPMGVEPLKIPYGKQSVITAYYTDSEGRKQDLTSGLTFELKDDGSEDFVSLVGNNFTPKKVGKFTLVVTSAEVGNYVETTKEFEIEIEPMALTVNWTIADEYIYNGNAQHPVATFTGVLDGDDCDIDRYEAYQLDGGEYKKVEDGAIHVGTYKIVPVFDNDNYSISFDDAAEIEIKPLAAQIGWDDSTLRFEYNGEDRAPTAYVKNLQSIAGVTDVCTVTVLGTKNASSAELTAKAYELSNPDYTLDGGTDLTQGFYIDPKVVTVTWGETELNYTGLSQAPVATPVGVLEGDECEVIVSGSQINAGTGFRAEAVGLTNSNYKLGTVEAIEFNIKAATLEIALKRTNTVYGTPFVLEIEGNSGNGKVTYSIVAGQGDDKATIGTGNLFTPTDVGTVTVEVRIAETGNYEGTTFTQDITISPRPIEVAWTNTSFEYDGELHNATATLVNAINGDDVELILSLPQANANTYTAEVTGVTNSKYTLTDGVNLTQEFVINPRVLEISWDDLVFTYNGTEQKPTATLDNVLEKDTCTVTVQGSKDAGTRILAEITEVSNPNYTIEGSSNATVRFTIKPKLALLEWANTTLYYDGTEQHPDAKVTNLEEGDECSVTISGAQIEVGDYKATATGLGNPNYTLAFDESVPEENRPVTEMDFHIVKSDIKVELSTAEVVFGSELTLSLVSNPGNGTVTYTVADGTGKASLDNNVLKTLKAGTVTVTVTVDDTDNYNGGTETFEVTIRKLPVEISWTYSDLTYNTKVQTPTATVANAVDGEDCNVTKIDGQSDAGENLRAKVVTLDNDNYTLEGGINVETTYAIQPKPISMITWDEDRVYPYTGELQGPKATAGGVYEQDTCEVLVNGWKTNAGKYTANITGLSNSNYSLDNITNRNIDFEITVAAPTITIKTTQVILSTWEEIEIEGNVGGGEVTFELVEGGEFGELSGNMIYGKKLGKVKVKVKVSSTTNTQSVEAEGEITVVKGQPTLKFSKTTVTYGSTLVLAPDEMLDENGNSMYGDFTYTVQDRFAKLAEIQEGNKLVAKGVGDIIVYVEMAESDYFDATESRVALEISIVQRIVTLKWEGDTFVYNAEDQSPTATVTNLIGDDTCEVTVTKGCNVGVYDGENASKAIELSNKNYTLERASNTTKDFEITPAELTLTWGELSLTYDKSEKIPEATLVGVLGEDEVDVELLVKDGKTPINAGTYTVTTGDLTGKSSGNYVLDADYETDYEIVPADLDPKFSPAQITYLQKEEIVLTGNTDDADFTLTVLKNDSVGFGTLTVENGKYMFEATRTGIVKIQVHIDATDNCNAFDGTVEIEVVKAERVTSLVSVKGTYGDNLILEISGNDGESGTVTYTIPDDYKNMGTIGKDEDGNDILIPKHAGTIAIRIKVSETENYKDEELTVGYVEIQRRIVDISWENTEFIYDGTVHTPTAKIGNLVEGDECGVTVTGGQINAGTYEDVEVVSLTNEDYTLAGSLTSTTIYTIGKKSIDATLKNTRIGADAPTKLVVLGNEGNAPVSFTVENVTGKATVDGDTITPSQKGTVYVTIHVEESVNHLAFTSQPILVIIDKSPLELTLSENTVLYGDELELVIDGNEGEEVKLTVTNGTGAAQIVSGNLLITSPGVGKAGTVYVTAYVAESDRYALTEEVFEITIQPRPVTIRWSSKNEFEYDGVNLQAPTATIIGGLLEGDEDCEVVVEGGQLEVGEYAAGTAYAASLTNTNYTLEGSDVNGPKFKITRAQVHIEFVTTAVTIGVPTKIKISGNKEFGIETFTLDIDSTVATPVGNAKLEGDVLTGTDFGFVHVTVSVAPTANYDGGFAEIDIEVEKPAAPVDFTNKQVTYGDTLNLEIDKGLKEDGSTADEGGAYSISLVEGKGSGKASLSGNVLSALGAGDVYVLIEVTETTTYKKTAKEIKITIDPIVIEVEWTYPELIYNGSEQTPTATVTNAINGDKFDIKYSGSVDAGTDLTAEITDAGNPNYTIEGAQGITTKYEIKPLVATLDWEEPDFTYNGKEQAPNATVTNLVGTDSAQVTVSGSTDAGNSLTATAVSIDNPNYTLEGASDLTYTFRIKSLTVTLVWGDLELPYNGQAQVPEATAVGTLNGDVVKAKVNGSTNKNVNTGSQKYQATAQLLDNPNYTLNGVARTDYTIVPAKVTFQTETLTKEYSGEKQDPTIVIDKLNSSDSITLRITGGQQTAVGDYPITLSISGGDSGNYYLDEADKTKTFSIVAKKVNVIVTTVDKEVDYTGSAYDFSGRDWYTLTCDDFVGDDVGKTVQQIFPIISIKMQPKLELNGAIVETAGVRGEYKVLAQTPYEGEISGNDNYEAVIVINTDTIGTLKISGGDALKLSENSTFEYSYVVKDDEYVYRSSYSEESWTHGKDDLKFDRVVLGNIPLNSSVGSFLDGLDANQLDKIRIYDQYGDLIFELGHAAEGIDESELYDADSYAVGTGWKVAYGLDEDAADVVYLSVLGDLNGDGRATSADITQMGRYIKGEIDFTDDEILLASLLCNFGEVSADDISYLGSVVRKEISTKDLF